MMSGISSILNIGKGALIAQQKAMEVTGHNLANVNTLGYTRQKVLLEAVGPFTADRVKIGLGVKIDAVLQCVDPFLAGSISQKTSSLHEFDSKQTVLASVEAIFNETSGHGLSQALDAFWKAWQDLAVNPGGTSERVALLERSKALCDQFHTMRSDLQSLAKEMNDRVGGSLETLNRITQQIADLNNRIVAAEAVGTKANDLRDARNRLVEELSGLVSLSTYENDQGSLRVVTANGILLVEGIHSFSLSQEGNEVHWNGIPSDISRNLTGGKIGAYLDLRDEVLPQELANLDELAGALIREVNRLHQAGYTLTGETGKNFFEDFKAPPETPNAADYTGAAGFIRLSFDVEAAPGQIAAGGLSGAPGDNENALRIAALETAEGIEIRRWSYKDRGSTVSSEIRTVTLNEFYANLVAEIGLRAEDAREKQAFNQSLIDELTKLRDSVSGVNLDEEMTELLQIQRAYEAAAKLVATADEMLRSLLEMR